MLSKAQFLAALRHETACTVHLAGKLKAKDLGYRFSKGQRSTLELLRYIAIQNQGLAAYLVQGNWDAWDGFEAGAKDLGLAGFAAAMSRQQRMVARLLAGVTDRELATRKVKALSGKRTTLGAALVDILKFAAAYKMQLFLQAKAAGHRGLVSANLWRGTDPKPA